MAKLNGNQSGNGFDKNPQNINRTGANKKPSFYKYFEEIAESNGFIEFENFKVILKDGSTFKTPKGSTVLIEIQNDRAKALKISQMAFKDVRWFEIEAKLRGLYQPIQIEIDEVEQTSKDFWNDFANFNDEELLVFAKIKRISDKNEGEGVSLDFLSDEEKEIFLIACTKAE